MIVLAAEAWNEVPGKMAKTFLVCLFEDLDGGWWKIENAPIKWE
jgi:hypothetical protein